MLTSSHAKDNTLQGFIIKLSTMSPANTNPPDPFQGRTTFFSLSLGIRQCILSPTYTPTPTLQTTRPIIDTFPKFTPTTQYEIYRAQGYKEQVVKKLRPDYFDEVLEVGKFVSVLRVTHPQLVENTEWERSCGRCMSVRIGSQMPVLRGMKVLQRFRPLHFNHPTASEPTQPRHHKHQNQGRKA